MPQRCCKWWAKPTLLPLLEQGDGIFSRTDYQRPLRSSDIVNPLRMTFMIGEDLPDQCLWVSWAYANKPFGTCAIPPKRRPRGETCCQPGSSQSLIQPEEKNQ